MPATQLGSCPTGSSSTTYVSKETVNVDNRGTAAHHTRGRTLHLESRIRNCGTAALASHSAWAPPQLCEPHLSPACTGLHAMGMATKTPADNAEPADGPIGRQQRTGSRRSVLDGHIAALNARHRCTPRARPLGHALQGETHTPVGSGGWNRLATHGPVLPTLGLLHLAYHS